MSVSRCGRCRISLAPASLSLHYVSHSYFPA